MGAVDMTPAQAVRIALEAIRREAKLLHFDANLYAHRGATYPHARNSWKRREKLRQAESVLRAMVDAKGSLPLWEKA